MYNMNNTFYVYNYLENKNLVISAAQIKEKYNFVNKRYFKLFNSEYNNDSAQIIFRDNGIIIKLNNVSAILSENDILLFSSYKHDEDEFIKHFKTKLNDINNEIPFSVWCFETILIYLSDYIDNYLEGCTVKFNRFSIDSFKSSQYIGILKFQHSLLVTKNSYQEIFESLEEINDEDEEFTHILFDDKSHKKELEKILNIYTNQLNEDVKNLERIIKEVNMFIDIANLKLADTRNKIAVKSIYINFTGIIITMGTYLNTLLGSNVKSGLEDTPYFMWWLLGINIIIMLISYFIFAATYKIKHCCKLA